MFEVTSSQGDRAKEGDQSMLRSIYQHSSVNARNKEGGGEPAPAMLTGAHWFRISRTRMTARALTGAIAGAIFSLCLFAADGALAYSQRTIEEGGNDIFRYSLPTFPHEARRSATAGYSAVRYQACTTDGTANGYVFHFGPNAYASGDSGTADYFGVCNLVIEFTSRNRFTKYYDFQPITYDDEHTESNEYFWIKLTNPEVVKWGKSSWESGPSSSTHVPQSITIQVTISDND